MAIYKEDIVTINLEAGSIFRSFKKHTIGTADSAADRFGIRVKRGDDDVDLSGCSCYGYFRDPQGNNIALTSNGTIDGNVAYVTLPQACYNYEGQFTLAIKLIGSGVTGTMRIVDGVIDNTNTGSAAAPTGTVPTYSEILSQYDAMVAATAAANGCIAETFDATKPYSAGKFVINSGALYVLTADHAANTTWANTTKDGPINFGDQLSDVKSALSADEYEYQYLGIKNIVRPYVDGATYTTTQGIKFSYDSGKINLNGTTSANNNATLIIFGDSSHFPIGIKAGETYYAQVVAQNQYIQFGLYYYTSGGTLTNIIRLLGSDGVVKFTVPSAAVGFRIALLGLAGTHAIDESVYIAITDTEPITYIREMVQKNTDVIATNEDKKNYILANKYQLWDKFNVIVDEYVQSDGKIVYDPNFVHCEIPVESGKTYYFATPDPTTSTGVKTGNAAYICLINTDNSIYPATNGNKSSIEIPNGVNRMIVSTYKTRLYNDEFSVIAYSTPTNTSANKWRPRYINYTQECIGSTYKVSCIGDSLTEGSGGEGTSYPGTIAANNASLEVMKFAFPSEDSLYIAYAVGGMRVFADPFTIPASNAGNAAPTITIKQDNGNALLMDHIAEDNLCMIGGVLGKLKYENSANKFQRFSSGTEIVLTRKEPIYQCFEMKHIGDITIIWVGTNDTQISSMTEAVFYHIDNIISLLPHKKYLVLGVMNNVKFTNIGNVMTYYRRHYGNHFVNIRQYLLDYGLSDAGITPTAQDTTDIANGTIPTSLRSDTVHLNASGYTVVGNYLYKLIQENGWLE